MKQRKLTLPGWYAHYGSFGMKLAYLHLSLGAMHQSDGRNPGIYIHKGACCNSSQISKK